MTELFRALLVGGLLVVAPGAVVLRAARLPGALCIGAAPPVSVLVVVAAGGGARVLGLPAQGPWGVALLAWITGVAAVLARRIGPGRLPWSTWAPRSAGRPAAIWLATSALFTVIYLVGTGSARAWPQVPDAIFHVGAVTWLVRHGSAWVGDVPAYSGLVDSPAPYPGAWHALASLVAGWGGVSPLVASHALVCLVAGAVWPAALTLLAWRVVGSSTGVSAIAATTALVLHAMPYHPITWGVLWPFLLGTSLLPLVLWAAHVLASTVDTPRTDSPGDRARAATLLVLFASGAALAHPSTVFVGVLAVPAVVLGSCWHSSTTRVRAVALTTWGVIALALWSLRPPAMLAENTFPPASGGVAVSELLTAFSPIPAVGLLLLGLTTTGLFVCWRRPDRWWVVGLAVGCLAAASVLSMLPPAARGTLLWPWWGDLDRLKVVATVPAALAIVVLASGPGARALRRARAPRTLVGLTGVAVIAVGVAPEAAYVHVRFHPSDPALTWASEDGRRDLAVLADRIPEGSVVAADPYAGGTHLYLTRDVRLLFPTEWSVLRDPELMTLGTSLDRAAQDPFVCRLLAARNVGYVVTGSTPFAAGYTRQGDFPAFERVGPEKGFTAVARSGEYRLWRVPRCRG